MSPASVKNVTVIGAGPIGRRLAALACAAGFVTTLEDVLPSNLRSARAELADAPAEALRFSSSVPDAVREADLVVDFVPDELESKLEIFSMVDRMAPPHTILLTPTAFHSIADLASCTYRGDRCFSFKVPEGLLQAAAPAGSVQVTQTAQTAADTAALVADFWQRLGWEPVISTDPAHEPSPALR